MRRLSLILLFLLSIVFKVNSQTNDSISFKVIDFSKHRAYLLQNYGDYLYVIDSVLANHNGRFSIAKENLETNGIYRISLGKDDFFGQERYFDFFYDSQEEVFIETDFYDCFYNMKSGSYSNSLLYDYYYYEDNFLDILGAQEYTSELIYSNLGMYQAYFSNYRLKLDSCLKKGGDKDVIDYIYALLPANYTDLDTFIFNYFDNINLDNPILYTSSLISNKTAQYFELVYLNSNKKNDSTKSVYVYLDNIYKEFIDSDQALSIMLTSLVKAVDNVPERQLYFEYLLQKVKHDSISNKAYRERNLYELESKVYITEGGKSPQFVYKDINNNVFTIEDMVKKHNILVFWSMECEQCVKLLNLLHEFASTSNNGDLYTIYAINTDGDKEKWVSFVNKDPSRTVVHLIDIEDDITAKEKFYISESPFIIDIDENGIIKGIFNLEEENSSNRFFNIID